MTAWRRRAAGGGLAVAMGAALLTAAPAAGAVRLDAGTEEGTVSAAAVAPDPPTNVTAVAGSSPGTAVVSWTPPTNDGGAAITSYRVSTQPGTASANAAGSETSATVTGLANGVTYTFTVRARNIAGSSLPSQPSNELLLGDGTAATVPDAPTGVTATAGDSSATVSWTAPASDGGAVITHYKVAAQPGTLSVEVQGAATTTADFPGLDNGIAYTFTVRAVNDLGSSPASAPSNQVVPGGGTPATAPDPPTGVTATPGNASATVSWTPPVNNGGAVIREYKVSVQPGTGSVLVTAPATSTVVPGLVNGQGYTFTVRAVNGAGTSLPSAPSNEVVPSSAGGGANATVPTAPRDVVATAGSGSATVTWSRPASDGGSTLQSYRVTAQPGTASVTVPASQAFAVLPLAVGERYTLTVKATNVVGTSEGGTSNAVTPLRVGGFDAFVTAGDFTGDRNRDVLARKAGGELWLYAGNGAGGWAASGRRIGTGWQGFTALLSTGDFTGDRNPDVLARKVNGELWLYAGNGRGGWAASGRRIGSGWQVFDTLVGPGDFTGDGKPDLLTRKPSGELWLYAGNGAGGWAASGRRIGTGWSGFDVVMSPRDFTGDGKADVLGRKPNGELWLYRGNGAGGWAASGKKIGTGWNTFDVLLGPGDFSGDRRSDVLARKPSGELWLYRGNGAGGWAASGQKIGTGW